jgi:hypothetical protein
VAGGEFDDARNEQGLVHHLAHERALRKGHVRGLLWTKY